MLKVTVSGSTCERTDQLLPARRSFWLLLALPAKVLIRERDGAQP
jgi:hypothetical protein